MKKKYTFESCKDLASNCKSRKEFRDKYNSAYVISSANGWICKYAEIFHWPGPRESKYTHEVCKELSTHFSTRSAFRDGANRAYKIALKNGWLDEFYPPSLKYPPLTKEYCRFISSHYEHRTDLMKGNYRVYKKCCKENWMDEFFPDTTINVRTLDYNTCYTLSLPYDTRCKFKQNEPAAYAKSCKMHWISDFYPDKAKRKSTYTFEICENIASQCHTIAEFRRLSPQAYRISCRNNWIPIFKKKFNYTSTGNAIRESRGFLTKNDILTIGAKYDRLSEFRKYERVAYGRALKGHFLHEMPWLYRNQETLKQFSMQVYVYEFDTWFAYVGITVNPILRHGQHCEGRTAVGQYANAVGVSIPEMKILVSNLTVKQAQLLEGKFIKLYEALGWNMINKAKPGSIGGLVNHKSDSALIKRAKKFSTLKELRVYDVNTYHTLLRRNLLRKCTWLTRETNNHKPNYWTRERCMLESQKFNARATFAKNSSGAYQAMWRHGWLSLLPY